MVLQSADVQRLMVTKSYPISVLNEVKRTVISAREAISHEHVWLRTRLAKKEKLPAVNPEEGVHGHDPEQVRVVGGGGVEYCHA